jgi:uncharacterized protein YidB (DUF937 family)
MTRGMPSMTALLGLLAIAGYQNRDKLAELLKGPGVRTPWFSTSAWWAAEQSYGHAQRGRSGWIASRRDRRVAGKIQSKWPRGCSSVLDQHRANKDISPPQLKEAIGSDVLQKLELETGLSQEEILVRLSRELPSAVDKYTPEGRLPGS